jgi:hypothetical protein
VSSQAHSSTEPSRAAHNVTTLTHVGESMRECSATYFTLKSSVSSAACMTTTAVVAARKTAIAVRRAEVCSRASRRTAPSAPAIAA